MPRARSSGSRSVSAPVSARMRAVLPWSMCPAVPSVSGPMRGHSPWSFARERQAHGRDHQLGLAIAERARIEEQATVVDPSEHGRIAGA